MGNNNNDDDNNNNSNNSNMLPGRVLKIWTLRCSCLLVLIVLSRPWRQESSFHNGILNSSSNNNSNKPTTRTETPSKRTESGKAKPPFSPSGSVYDTRGQHKTAEYNTAEYNRYNNTTTPNEPILLTLQDFPELTKRFQANNNNADHMNDSWEQAAAKRAPIVDLLQRAGLRVDLDVLNLLIPTWSSVQDLYGPEPVILGKERCEAFRNQVPARKRFVGVAGQMNVGTNALSHYLIDNLAISQNPVNGGIMWTVPWWKHSWASLRNKYHYRLPHAHELSLPVIIIRDPYFWMKSMCQSPYTMDWNRTAAHCPNLVEESALMDYSDDDNNNADKHQTIPDVVHRYSFNGDNNNNDNGDSLPAEVGVSVGITWSRWAREWHSLAHVWTEWYREYVQADYPRLMVRFEDLLFHTETVLEEIRDCIGAEWIHEEIHFQTAPAKQGAYFESYKKQNGFVSALIKYGRDDHDAKQGRTGNMTLEDLEYSQRYLGRDLMDLFHYKSPE